MMQEAREIGVVDEPESEPTGRLGRGWLFVRSHRLLSVLALAALVAVVLYAKSILIRPAAEAVLKADALHAEGRHDAALAVYRQVVQNVEDHEKIAVLERIVRCAREAGDESAFLSGAIDLLAFDQHAWFGDRNFMLAETVLKREISLPAMPYIARRHSVPTVELAIIRLRLALAAPEGTAAEREQARENLAALCKQAKTLPEENIDEIFRTGRPSSDESPADLLAQAADESQPEAIRARAAYFAGWRLEQTGRPDKAVAAFRQAYDLISAQTFVYFGLVSAQETIRPRSLGSEPEMQRMLRHMAGTIQRLDPSAPDVMRGGLRFHVEEPELPPELGLKAVVTLEKVSGADGSSPSASAEPTLPSATGEVPIQLDRTGLVGLLDGEYRLGVKMGRRPGTPPGPLGTQIGPQYQFLEFDLRALPAEVEVRGETIDLPAIRPYFSKEIGLTAPAEGAAIDLGQTEFQWNAVPEASRYELDLVGTVRTPGGTVLKSFTARDIGAPRFKIEQFASEDAKALASQSPGTEDVLEVRGYDDRGLLVAKTLGRRKFFVGKVPEVIR
jgi:hypothetical protein